MRVDNPNADGQRNCNTDGGRVEAGRMQTLTVSFGKPWGGQGLDLDESDVVGVLVLLDRPAREYALALDNLRANPRRYAELPE